MTLFPTIAAMPPVRFSSIPEAPPAGAPAPASFSTGGFSGEAGVVTAAATETFSGPPQPLRAAARKSTGPAEINNLALLNIHRSRLNCYLTLLM